MGQRHRAITLSDGTVVFDVLGAEGDEDEDDEDEDDDDDDEDDSDDDADKDSKDKSKKNTPTVKSLTKELEAEQAKSRSFERRMKAADRDKMRYMDELEELKKGGKKELSDARSEIETLKSQLAAKSGLDKTSIIRDEFLTDDTYDWQNRKVAFGLLDLDEVEVSDKGKIDRQSLKDAVAALAKDHPYLVKPKAKAEDDDEDEDQDEDDSKTKRQPSGRQPNTGLNRRKQTRKVSEDDLKKRYQILNGRV